mmetsp:Transcript_13493/g.19894  ORF Transcript_13493/g.19894 Transcript_13493/m.19894 type:complete len:228 (+) Transcript_13493:19-702(+)
MYLEDSCKTMQDLRRQQRRPFHVVVNADDSNNITEVECELKSSQKQSSFESYRRRKSLGDSLLVSFDDEAYLAYTFHRQDYSAHLCWYDREELLQIKQENTPTLKLMMSGKLRVYGEDNNSEDDYCARGLECCILEGAASRKTNRLNASLAVYKEQMKGRRLRDSSLHVADAIAAAYHLAGGHDSAMEAHERGLLDEREVQQQTSLKQQQRQPVVPRYNRQYQFLHQ